MDFSYLMELANQNKDKSDEKSISRFSTKLSAPKKIEKKPKITAVEKFLSEKEALKKKKDEEFTKKRDNLLALRAQNKNARRFISGQQKRTLAASKAVLEDAKDLVVLRGEEQCDEDDYGYESAMSQKIFEKLATTYATIPDDDRLKFQKKKQPKNLDDIKSRVMGSLKVEEEEKLGIRKRKKKPREGSSKDDVDYDKGDFSGSITTNLIPPEEIRANKAKEMASSKGKIPVNLNMTNHVNNKYDQFKYKKNNDSKEKKKNKPAATVAPSFQELMKMAQEKNKNPGAVNKIFKTEVKIEKKKEEERPLTAKERQDAEEEKMRKMKRAWKLGGGDKDNGSSKEGKDSKSSEKSSKESKESSSSTPPPKVSKKDIAVNYDNEKPKKSASEKSKKPEAPPPKDKSKYFANFKSPNNAPKPQDNNSKPSNNSSKTQNNNFKAPNSVSKPQNNNHSKKDRDRYDAPQKSKSRPFPQHDEPRFKRPPPPRPPVNVKKQRIESDSDEYDSEMDDFIDDGDADLDYSSEIKKMFNYDKSKFADEDDDLGDMESSYGQLEREEIRSAKIGLREDLEDMKMEEAMKKQKLMKKKMKGRR